MSSYSIYACTAYPIVVEGLHRVLSTVPALQLVGSSPAGAETLEVLAKLCPNIVLVDLTTSLRSTLQFVDGVRSASPNSHVVLWVTELEEGDCLRALQLGVRGILKKTLPPEVLPHCLNTVASGQIWIEHSLPPDFEHHRRPGPRLTARERDVVRCVCQGLRNKEISGALGITPGTVKVHLMHIFEKTGVKDRLELAAFARHLQDVPVPVESVQGAAS